MKQTIEIEVLDGKKAVWKDNKVVFEKSQLPKTWEEFCENYDVKDEERNYPPNEKSAKAHLALMQIHQLRDCYRQGWKHD